MNSPRVYRGLRIAASAVCLIVCGFVVVLWVRSNSLADICGVTFGGEKRTGVSSEKGRVFAIIFDYETSVRVMGKARVWDIRSETIASLYPTARTEEELIQQMGVPSFPGLDIKAPGGYYRVVVPHWFLVLLSVTFAAGPWIRWCYSLRTLLIATTLSAAVLGLIVALAR